MITIRQMILNIKSQEEKKRCVHLFQRVDNIKESSKVYLLHLKNGVEVAHYLVITEKNVVDKELTPMTNMMNQQEQDLILLLHNPDLDPISPIDKPVNK